MPCKITMSLLKNTCNLWDCINYFGTDMDMMLEFIFAIGKNEEEQKTIASFLQDLTRLSFNDGAEHKYCFEHLEREIYKKYHADEENAKVDAEIEEDLMKEYEQQWELDYYKDEFQKLKAENARMQAELEQLKKHIEDVDDRHSITQEEFNAIFNPEGDNAANDNAQNQSADENLQQQLADAQNRIAELEKIIGERDNTIEELNNRVTEFEQAEEDGESISAHNKVRMELIMKFMEKDGLTLERNGEKIHGHKTKAAKILETLTGLPLQTCKNYITNRDLNIETHREEILRINTLLQALRISSKL